MSFTSVAKSTSNYSGVAKSSSAFSGQAQGSSSFSSVAKPRGTSHGAQWGIGKWGQAKWGQSVADSFTRTKKLASSFSSVAKT